jgi:phosphatidylglycerophosphatase A
MKRLVILFATWGGTGYSPFASGTVGTLGAIPFYLILARLSLPLYLLTTVAFAIFACWVAGEAERIFQEKDSKKIVIDEVAGYLVTMCGIFPGWKGVVAGFFFFRLFDIIKPQPARYFDRSLHNGYGVVLDDVAAGLYACLSTHILVRFL